MAIGLPFVTWDDGTTDGNVQRFKVICLDNSLVLEYIVIDNN